MGADISNLVHKYGEKVKDLKTRLPTPAEEKGGRAKLKELIWNAMDPGSKMTATQMGIHRQEYAKIVEHIDERFKVTYGHVEFQLFKNDPMGVFLVGERDPRPAEETSIEEPQRPHQSYNDQAHLDAFDKGKGTGWMHNGGKCDMCQGEGHIAQYCPSA